MLTPTGTASATQRSLLGLPKEIRLLVWDQVALNIEEEHVLQIIRSSVCSTSSDTSPLALLSTCRLVDDEARPILFAHLPACLGGGAFDEAEPTYSYMERIVYRLPEDVLDAGIFTYQSALLMLPHFVNESTQFAQALGSNFKYLQHLVLGTRGIRTLRLFTRTYTRGHKDDGDVVRNLISKMPKIKLLTIVDESFDACERRAAGIPWLAEAYLVRTRPGFLRDVLSWFSQLEQMRFIGSKMSQQCVAEPSKCQISVRHTGVVFRAN